MYSTCNEGKSVAAERFFRTLNYKIFKHITAISKNVYSDMLDGIANKYNNTVHKTIKTKPIDVTNFNKKDPKFKVGDNVRNFLKTFLLEDIPQIGQKKFLLLIKLKIQFLGLMLLVT